MIRGGLIPLLRIIWQCIKIGRLIRLVICPLSKTLLIVCILDGIWERILEGTLEVVVLIRIGGGLILLVMVRIIGR